MAIFEYQALAETGKKVKGVIDADTASTARLKLREQKLFPTEITESASNSEGGSGAKSGGLFSHVTSRDLTMMTRQLAVLLHAGMPLVESLSALMEQTSKSRLRNAIFEVKGRVSEGTKLADGMSLHPKIFSSLYVNMVRAGEASGQLEQVLFRLTDVLEREAKMKSKVIGTLAYPGFMIVFACAIITFLMVIIIPRITQLFEKQGQDLPRITEIMIGTADFVGSYWYLLIGGSLAAIFGWRYWVATPDGRLRWDKIKLTVPLVGGLYLKIVCARFARILGTMLDSGLTMMRALDVVTTVLQNKYVEEAMGDVKAGVRRGRDLAAPLKETGIFPPLLIHMVDLGQRSGELESMLIKVADTYDEDVQVTVDALVSLLEPIIIVVMGLFVGFLVLSILLPILNMSTSIR